MHFAKKINLKRYFLITSFTTAGCLYFAQNSNEVIGIIIVSIFAAISQFGLTEAVCLMTKTDATISDAKKKKKLTILMILKLVFLFGGIGLGVLFMGKRVIIPLLNYILQIAALGVSLREVEL